MPLLGKLNLFVEAPPCLPRLDELSPSWRSQTPFKIHPLDMHQYIYRVTHLCSYLHIEVKTVKSLENNKNMAATVLKEKDVSPELAAEWAMGTVPPLTQWQQHDVSGDRLKNLYVYECSVHIKFPSENDKRYVDSFLLRLISMLIKPFANRYTVDTAKRHSEMLKIISEGEPYTEYRGTYAKNLLTSVSQKTEDAPESSFQPSGLNVPMRPYQRKNLNFALNNELMEESPFWLPLVWHESNETLLYWSPYYRTFSTTRPCPIRGGFIADEMGMGKTICTLALILSTLGGARVGRETEGVGGTLVVCPVSLVGQWCKEAAAKLDNDLSVYKYYGASRNRKPEILRNYDIVVTTYGVLASDKTYGARKALMHGNPNYIPPLQRLRFQRVVFDESHVIKNTYTSTFKACKGLKAKYKWCISGTPICTDWTDVIPQMNLISNEFRYLNRLSRFESMSKAFSSVLNQTMVRHHKEMKVNGEYILKLPACSYVDHNIHLSDEAWSTYETTRQNIVNQLRHCRPIEIMHRLQVLRRQCSSGFSDDNLHVYKTFSDDDEELSQRFFGLLLHRSSPQEPVFDPQMPGIVCSSYEPANKSSPS